MAVWASCANEYAKEEKEKEKEEKEKEKEKNTTLSGNFMAVLLATVSDSLLKNTLT